MTYREKIKGQHEFLLCNIEYDEAQSRMIAASGELLIARRSIRYTKVDLEALEDILGSAIGNINSVLRAIRKAKRQVEQAALADLDADMERRYNGQG